jgi:uncharacterized protein YdaU (DUF1376 family)
MNYYERHLGDYARDTSHLSMLEHGALNLLLDRYYATEKGIPDDIVMRVAHARNHAEKQAVASVLNEFFVLTNGVWVSSRAEREIEKKQNRVEANKKNGASGGRPKTLKNQHQSEPSGLSLGSERETETKGHQSPVTSTSSLRSEVKEFPSSEHVKSRKQKTVFDPESISLPNNVSASDWKKWCQHRREISKPLTKLATEQQIAALSEMQDPCGAILHSIANGYQGIFPPKNYAAKPHKPSSHDIPAASAFAGKPTVTDGHGNPIEVPKFSEADYEGLL